MNIVVCIKQVPDPKYYSQLTLNPKTGTLNRKGIPLIMNPNDRCALEEAVRIKEKMGGAVTVISMGPPEAEDVLYDALALGADRAVLLSDRAFAGADSLATAFPLAQAIMKLEQWDLVLCGEATEDSGTGNVGAQVAEFLGVPHAYKVVGYELGNSAIKVRVEIEKGVLVSELGVPAVISLKNKINKPRIMKVPDIVWACQQKVEKLTAGDLQCSDAFFGASGSPSIVVGTQMLPQDRKCEILQGGTKEVVKNALNWMMQKGVLDNLKY